MFYPKSSYGKLPSQSLAIPDSCCKFRGSRPQQGGKSYAEGVKNNISTYIRKNLRSPKPVSTLFIKDAGLGCISVVFVVHIAL